MIKGGDDRGAADVWLEMLYAGWLATTAPVSPSGHALSGLMQLKHSWPKPNVGPPKLSESDKPPSKHCGEHPGCSHPPVAADDQKSSDGHDHKLCPDSDPIVKVAAE